MRKLLLSQRLSRPMPYDPGVAATTPLSAALERVGDRWSLLLIEALLDGPRRFGELSEAVEGIAPNILSERLKRLEGERVIRRDALLGAAAAVQLRADRRGAGAGRRPAAPGRLGSPWIDPRRADAARRLRDPGRSAAVVPDLRALGGRAGGRRALVRLSGRCGIRRRVADQSVYGLTSSRASVKS